MLNGYLRFRRYRQEMLNGYLRFRRYRHKLAVGRCVSHLG
jgi:hypothetical protein